MTATDFLKPLIPQMARSLLRERQRKFVFDRALRRFMKEPARWSTPGSAVLEDLIYGWRNEGWSARNGFLVACLQHAFTTPGAVLECGSGLTTILLGIIADCRGNSVWTLEHLPDWAVRLDHQLQQLGIRGVQQSLTGLRNYGDFTWYDVQTGRMPDFSLVVCDGPPADTRGGRYGLVPVMRDRLKPGATILLDDAAREEECAIARRWAEELGATYEFVESDAPYIILTLPR